jgi:hypothetical protein
VHTYPLVSLPACPTTPAGYADAFAARGRWGGGDCGPLVRLHDGRCLWVFGDTWLDPPADGRPGPMVQSTMVVQSGGDFELLVGDGDTPALPDPGGGQWLWATAGGWATPSTVYVVANRMVPSAGPWGFDIVGGTLVGFDPVSWTVKTQTALPWAPGWSWNGGVALVDGLAYVWGWNGAGTVVARANAGMPAGSVWTVWAGGSWSRTLANAVPVAIEASGFVPPAVEPYAGGYLASGQLVGGLAEPVHTWWAPAPVGPFRYIGVAASTAEAGVVTYAGRVGALPCSGPTVVWSAGPDGSGSYDTRRYGLRFAGPAATARP